MKKETMDLLLEEAQKNCEIEVARGRKAEIVYLPCVVGYNDNNSSIGLIQMPDFNTIIKSENNWKEVSIVQK